MQQGLGESMMESTFNNNLTNTSSYATAPGTSKVLAPLRSPGGVGRGGVSGGPSLKRGGLSPPRSRGKWIVPLFGHASFFFVNQKVQNLFKVIKPFVCFVFVAILIPLHPNFTSTINPQVMARLAVVPGPLCRPSTAALSSEGTTASSWAASAAPRCGACPERRTSTETLHRCVINNGLLLIMCQICPKISGVVCAHFKFPCYLV